MTDLTRRRGDTYPDEFVIKSKTTGQPINIAGFSFLLTVDPSPTPVDDTNNLFSLTGNIIDGPNGLVEFAPSAIQADQLGVFYYDIQMTDTASKIRTIEASDKYEFKQDITK